MTDPGKQVVEDERRLDPGAAIAFAIPLVLVVYLALSNGGFDPISREEVGLAVWWMVLIGVLVGLLPTLRLASLGGVLVVLLAGLAAWTALSLAWTESDERTMLELERVAGYLGVLVLGLGVTARGYGRQLLAGVTAALAIVVVLAALSRMQPGWFPDQNVGEFLPDVELESRLAYPINYSSGLAVVCGLAIPLLLALAAAARSAIAQTLAAAALPVAALTLWLTGSSLALPLIAIGLIAFLWLARERIPALTTLVLAGIGGAILIVAASSKDALDRGLETPEAFSQGDQLLVITIVVCFAVAAAQLLLSLLFRRRPELRGPLVPIAATLAAIGLAIVLGVAAGVPGKLSERLDDFTSAEGLDPNEGDRGDQVLDVSARGRFQYWESSLDAYGTEPALGIGPGTFEFWWAREGDPDAAIFIRDAHSLYLETLAELGPVGLLLVLALIVTLLIGGIRSTLRSRADERTPIAAATAACFVFAAAAAVDWVWELAALPAAFLLLASVATGERPAPGGAPAIAPMRSRALTAGLAVVALIAIAIPYAGTTLVDQSRESASEDRLDDALAEARNAAAVQPNAATPRIQEATVLELLGDLDGAVLAAREATERESTNWRLWIVLSRLEARNGDAQAAVEAYEQGQSLFPRGVLVPR
ncbi:MAG: O-antigen ligase family protein [Solirubrobacterales bacterium]